MAMMTGAEYIESLRKLNTRVYMFGEKIENWVDHPMIRPSINCVAVTYDLAQDPQYEDLMTATLEPHRQEDQPLRQHPPKHRRLKEKGKDAETAADRRLLRAFRDASVWTRSTQNTPRPMRSMKNTAQHYHERLQEVPAVRTGERPRRRRRNDRPEG